MKLSSRYFRIFLLFFFVIFCSFSLVFSSEKITLTVAKFQNLSKDKSIDWLSDDFAETISSKLANLKDIIVVERSQMAELLKEAKLGVIGVIDENNAAKFGKFIGAKFIIIGNYRKINDTIKVIAKVVDIEKGDILCSAIKTVSDKKISVLQDEITLSIAKALPIVLTEEDEKMIIGEFLFESHKKAEKAKESIKYIKLARDYDLKKDYDNAIFCYSKLIELDPSDSGIYASRGDMYEKIGLLDKAIDDYTSAIETLLVTMIEFKRYDKKSDWKEWEKIQKYYLHFQRGRMYLKKDMYNEAIDDFTTALENLTYGTIVFCNTLYNRALCYGLLGLDEKAKEDLIVAAVNGDQDARDCLKESFGIERDWDNLRKQLK